MNKIPITIIFMTSTKQHFGFKDVYSTTLSHLTQQIPLNQFNNLIAHIKVSENEIDLGNQMEEYLVSQGFKVIKTVKNWSRGSEHQNEYLSDLITISKEPSIYDSEYILWLEDDSLMISNQCDLEECLSRMIEFLQDPDVLSARFLRRGDWITSQGVQKVENDFFWSSHLNFQPAILRSRDFFLVNKIIEDNLKSLTGIQIEMLWRLVLAPFSRSEHKHVVWLPDYAESIHLGVPDYPKIKQSLGL